VSSVAQSEKELFVRHARKDGRSVVEAEVYPAGGSNPSETVHPGPYTFANAVQATQFVTEAVEALMVLGCDVQAQ
jgi:hypothetical protein